MGVYLTPRPDCDYLSADPRYILALKVISGIFSGLSLFGALTVIFFHFCCSRLWPNKIVRHIVVMLSIADLLVAISHIWGATQTLEKFMEAYHPNGSDFSNTDVQCTAQAVLSIVGTLSSFLWTLALVSYVLIVTSMPGKVAECCQNSAVIALYSVPCWGFPLLLTIVLARLYLLGYAENVDLGWCYISFSSEVFSDVIDIHQGHLELLFSYELWTWLIIGAIILCIILYITVHLLKKNKYCDLWRANVVSKFNRLSESQPVTAVKRLEGYDDGNTRNLTDSMGEGITNGIKVETPSRTQTQSGVNLRPVMAGVFLLGLRLFSTIVDITIMVNDKYSHADWIAIVVVIAAIGDSLQGFVNMFLFVLCTTPVKKNVKKVLCKCNINQARYMPLR